MANQRKSFSTPTAAFLSGMREEPEEQTKSAPEGYTVPQGYKLVRESKSARLQLLVTPAVSADLKSAAAAEGISLNELCNRIFEGYLKGDK